MSIRRITWGDLDAPARAVELSRPDIGTSPDTLDTVREIVARVRSDGDRALIRYAETFDGITLEDLRLDVAEIDAASTILDGQQRAALEMAFDTLKRFHDAGRASHYRVETVPGVTCATTIRPIRSVGLYVPGGSAPLPSTALMLGVPSMLAGNPVRILCTPSVHPAILYAARLCGITDIFRIGGAQAIAAMAYGTESVPRVDKIFGPGNAYVTAAKQQVAASVAGVAIDMPAGPSELMVVADDTANPEYVAADLLSQAEHGPGSQVFLVTDSQRFAQAVDEAIARQLQALPRRDLITAALKTSRTIVVSAIHEALAIVNAYAPEHLILALDTADELLGGVESAGSVFLGHWTPESLGDYCSGTNHVLPTYGYARTLSGLSVSDFEKRITVQRALPEGLDTLGPVAMTLAELEGLGAHSAAVRIRMETPDVVD